jgi:hypothetical protein
MDFQKLLGKLDQIDLATSEPKAEKIATAPTTALTEDAQIRVLAGLTSILEEGRRIVDRETIVEKKLTAAEKDKKEEVVKSMKKDKDGFKDRYGKKGDEVMHATATKIAKKAAESIESIDEEDELDEVFDADAKVGDKKKTSSGVATKTATGMKHEKTYSDDEDSKDSGKKKAAKESFRAKFDAMVEAKKGSKPDFLDIDKDGDKKEPMKKAVADKKKGAAPKKGVNPFAKKDESVKESDDMKVGDKKKSSTGGTIEKTKTGVKHTAGKNYSGKAAEVDAKKKTVKESVGAETVTTSGGNTYKFKSLDDGQYAMIDYGSGKIKLYYDYNARGYDPEESKASDPRVQKILSGIKGLIDRDDASVDDFVDMIMQKTVGESRMGESVVRNKKVVAESVEQGVAEGSAHGYNVVKWFEKWNDQKKLVKWLRKEAGLPNDDDIYFDDADLVYGDKTIVRDALVDPNLKFIDLLNAVAQATGGSTKQKVQGVYREQRMSFKQCLQMVKESGGQQQIDPVDGELWKWAQRVASAKVEESAARDAMAAFVYERMGGDFQLYDVLSENQK